MPKTDNVRQVDLPRVGSGGSVYVRSGSSGGASNADTVDGYHAGSTRAAGRLLALDTAARFDPGVIDWNSVAGAGLDDAGNTLVVLWGTSPTTIVPDASTGGGSASTSARSDHTHAIAAAAPATNLTVTSSNAEGDATSFARSNHTHAITSSANPGAAASILASSASGYLQLVRLGAGVAPSHALHARGTTPQLRLESDADNYATLGAGGTGNLTITPSGNSVLLPSGKTLSSANWASQTTGWGIYPESTHGRDGYADFRYIYADEMHVKVFIADMEQALAGGQIISKSVAIIAADFTIPAKGATATLTVEDLPGTTAAVFASGDWIRVRNISRSGGSLVVADAYGTVGSATPNGDGTQSYTFSRPAGDTGSAATSTVVPKGGLALDYGVSGNGSWEVTTLDPAGSPYAQVATWATHPQTQTVRVRLGNLDGIAGIGAEWGFWAGTDVNHQFKASSGSVELRGIPQYWLDASNNVRGAVDPTATGTNALFWLGPSSGDKRLVVQADGVVLFGAVNSTSVAGWAHASDLTKIDGGDIYTGSVTAAKLTVRGLNMIGNPGFETGTFADWTDYGVGGVVYTGEAANAHSGTSYLRGAGTGGNVELCHQSIRVLPGRNYAASIWAMYVSATGGTAGGVLTWYDAAGASISSVTFSGTLSGSYQRFSAVAQAPSNAWTALVRPYIAASVSAGIGVRFDDVEFYLADGQVVVGSPAGARVEINNSGIEGYSDASTKQFYLRTSDGRGMFGAGKGVLDASGLVLSGNETSYNTYNATRWLTVTDPPGGSEVARIAAGRWGGLSNYWEMTIETNPGLVAGYPSDILMRANTKAASGSGANYIRGGLRLNGEIVQASAILYTEVDTGAGNASVSVYGTGSDSYIKFMTNDTERLRITHAGDFTYAAPFAFGPASTLVISSDAITITGSFHLVDTEGSAATDNLATISGGSTGSLLVLRSVDSGRDVTLKDSTGNLYLAGDFTLSTFHDTITLIKVSSNWFELSRSDNA